MTITALKEQLLASHHNQAAAIESRFNNVMSRWV